jgi:23S rRNA pseudouridine2605 synthase
MSQDAFRKFVNPKKNSVVKEEIRQEKKQARKEKRAYFEQKKAEEYKERMAKRGAPVRENEVIIKGASGFSKTIVKPVDKNQKTTEEVMPLNKFLAHCGVTSRRDAVTVIADGKVKVNGEIATEPGYKVQPTDEVIFNGKKLFVTKNLVYILLNKPKDYITTTDDPQGRKTVLQLIKAATDERVYPIGRLDRNTSGVLLLTNDGDLTQKLSHPSYEIRKIYEVKLDKQLTKTDFEKILAGLTLEDGPVLVDSLAYADVKDKSIIGIEIHSGRNRIVRRIFESLGYDVKGLDRVMYAGLTKKNVERSKWRYLSDKEIRLLKFMNESKKNKNRPTDAEIEAGIADTAPKAKKEKVRAPKLTDEEIGAAIGEEVAPKEKRKFPMNNYKAKPKKAKEVKEKIKGKEQQQSKTSAPKSDRVKEDKMVKPRKFKTHSEKKKYLSNLGKK